MFFGSIVLWNAAPLPSQSWFNYGEKSTDVFNGVWLFQRGGLQFAYEILLIKCKFPSSFDRNAVRSFESAFQYKILKNVLFANHSNRKFKAEHSEWFHYALMQSLSIGSRLLNVSLQVWCSISAIRLYRSNGTI